MKGDILIIDINHKNAAKQIVEILLDKILKTEGKFLMTVAGESGAGKSEIADSIAEQLKKHHLRSYVFGQDDYFKLPPRTNALRRKQDIGWVGPQEVNIDSLEQTITDVKEGKTTITKPLVDFCENCIGEETINLSAFKVIIVEGTYTTLLNNVDCRIFIDRNKFDTSESRKKRGREKQDDFLDRILTIEHEIISKHKGLADLIISKDWKIYLQNE